ncbi:MAG: hypothetical protein ACHQAX_01910 [Gammaproteobacteria bacterium]
MPKNAPKDNKRDPHDLGVKEPLIHKDTQKKHASSLKKYWIAVQDDVNKASKSSLDDLYNLAYSLFELLKYVENKVGTISEALRRQLLIYLSQLIGTMAKRYGETGKEMLEEDNETLAFQQEVQAEVSSTRLYYYSPEKCESGHAIHHNKDNKEIGKRITVVNEALSALPTKLVKKLHAADEEDLSCLEDSAIHDPKYLEMLNKTAKNKNVFNVFDDEKKYPNVFITDIPYKPNTLDAIKAALGAATGAANRTIDNIDTRAPAEKLFCVIRPPSHHAHHEHPEGFCYASTLMYGAKKLMDDGKRVLIVDFDAHHGNGTYEQLTRLNQDPWYGNKYHFIDVYAEESYLAGVPSQSDANATMSFYPLKHQDHTGAKVLSCIQAGIERARSLGFTPDAIVVSAGFDAVAADNYGGRLSSEDYSPIGAALAACCPHMISFLEGGYDLTALPQSVKHYMLGTIGPVNQPAPQHVKQGLTFVYNSLKDAIAPDIAVHMKINKSC